MTMELLAPAGSLDCGLAAFAYGADAVYLGMRQFSARADAENFDLDDLRVLTGVAHGDKEHPRRIYVAVNTLVRDDELHDVLDELEAAALLEELGARNAALGTLLRRRIALVNIPADRANPFSHGYLSFPLLLLRFV